MLESANVSKSKKLIKLMKLRKAALKMINLYLICLSQRFC